MKVSGLYSLKNGRWAALLLCCLVVYSPLSVSAQETSEPEMAPESEQDVEVLLDTMNELLSENRQMRPELEEARESVEKLSRENRFLRSRVDKLEKETQSAGEKERQRVKGLQKKLDALEMTAGKLASENKQLENVKAKHEKEIERLKEEADQLRQTLDNAILKGERGEYLKLIQSAQEMAAGALEELAVHKSQTAELKNRLAASHYQLGNMLFDLRDFENAIASYEKALEINPQDPWVHHNLAIIYDYYIHDNAQALYHYKRYLNVKPVDEEAHKIRERILDLQLKKNMKPEEPLEGEYYGYYTKVPR